jgi:hypothetical protein
MLVEQSAIQMAACSVMRMSENRPDAWLSFFDEL